VQHHVVVVEDGFEVLALVVDDDVGAEALDQRDVGGAGGGGSEMLRQLDGERAHTARPGLDENLLSVPQLGSTSACRAVPSDPPAG
jgi:hypothetical protein